MPAHRVAVWGRAPVSQPGADGAPRIRPGRVPVLRPAAARAGAGITRDALSAARSRRERVERAHGYGSPVPREPCRVPGGMRGGGPDPADAPAAAVRSGRLQL